MSRLLRLRDGTSINTVGLVVVAVVIASAIMAALVVLPVWSLYRHPPQPSTASRSSVEAINAFRDATARGVEMVDNRSWFYEPRPPAPVEAPVSKPRYYGGPQLLAFINGTAMFADGQRVSAAKPKDKTVEFVRSNAPWSITVKWEGAEFDVDLFKRVDLLSVKDGPSGYAPPPPSASPALGAPTRNLDGSLSTGRPPSDRAEGPPEARMGPGVAPAPGAASPPPDAHAPVSGVPGASAVPPSAAPGSAPPHDPAGAKPATPPSSDPQPGEPQPAPQPAPTPAPSPAPPPEPSKEPAPGSSSTHS